MAKLESEDEAAPTDPEHDIEQVFADSEPADGAGADDEFKVSGAYAGRGTGESLVAASRMARSTQRQSTAWMGWTALVSVVAVILASSILLAETISELWPPAKRLYAMVNLPLTGPAAGLDIQDIAAHFEDGENGPILVIEGNIVNMSGSVKSVPMVRVSLNDESRAPLTEWVFTATDFNLIPSEIVTFRTSRQAPPEAAVFASLGFSSTSPPPEEAAEAVETPEDAE